MRRRGTRAFRVDLYQPEAKRARRAAKQRCLTFREYLRQSVVAQTDSDLEPPARFEVDPFERRSVASYGWKR